MNAADDVANVDSGVPPHVNQQQFGGIKEGNFTPTFNSPHMAPKSSAYGTDHPVDRALGKAYRLKSLAGVAKGQAASSSDVAHAASNLMMAGSRPGPEEM